MTKKTIDPAEWNKFLAEFSDRNRGRRVRFEEFSRSGVAEEDEEGAFESLSIDNYVVEVKRKAANGKPLTDHIDGVHGISVQYDSDSSENTMEFMDTNGNMTVMHFESKVDGDS